MVIESATIFQGFLAVVGSIISVLAGIAIWNNRHRYNELEQRLKDVESRINLSIPEAIQSLKMELSKMQGSLQETNTKVELISDSVIRRMDKLEADFPALIEASFFKIITTHKQAMPDINL